MTLTQASEGGLKISNAGSDGQFLQKQSGNTGGLTWATPADTNTQVGGATGVDFNDDVYIRLGTGNDLKIWHNAGANSYIRNESGNLLIESNGAGADAIQVVAGGAVELFHNGTKKLNTDSWGVAITGELTTTGHINIPNDTGKFMVGASNDLQIYHDGTDSWLMNTTGDLTIQTSGDDIFLKAYDDIHLRVQDGSEEAIICKGDGAVEFYHNGTKKFETHADGLHIGDGGNLDMPSDSSKIVLGASDDFQFRHNGSHSYINSSYGNFFLQCGSGTVYLQAVDDENGIKILPNSHVELFYNGSKKLYTYTEGVKVDGYIKALHDVSDSHWGDNNDNWHHIQNNQADAHSCIFENSGDSNPYGNFIYFSDAAPDDNTRSFYQFQDNVAVRGYIYSDGDLWNHDNSYTGSDATLKENIVDATPKLEDLKKLKVRNFNWKADYFPNKSKKKQLGFIAQEVEQVFPSLVSEHDIAPGVHASSDHTPVRKKAIKQAWDPIIIKAMQELITKVETLETKVAALEAA